ncbi:MAG TPA: 3-oxoadipate enol-lactonase [Burkholderiaceae bacterium]|nr:3-oxoadipate enol-lactonase [Burkholderiaceae bacterium]
MKSAHVNGVDIAYTIEPGARPGRPWLVFSHSLAADHSMWWPQVDVFGAAYNVLRYDTRGHGASAAPDGAYSLDQLGDDLLQLLAVVGIERCHFVGLSMGGMIGQAAVLRDPRPFESLVLADTSSRIPPEAHPVWESRIAAVSTPAGMAAVAPATLERWFTAAFRAREPGLVAHIDRLIRATRVTGYIGCSRAIMQLDLTDRLHRIECPVLVLVGDQDAGTPPAMAEAIARAIPGAGLEVIPHAAHLSNIEQAERFNALMQRFYSTPS